MCVGSGYISVSHLSKRKKTTTGCLIFDEAEMLLLQINMTCDMKLHTNTSLFDSTVAWSYKCILLHLIKVT